MIEIRKIKIKRTKIRIGGVEQGKNFLVHGLKAG